MFLGKDVVIDKNITMHIPRIGEIIECGEEKYNQLLSSLISSPDDYKPILFDMGIDYKKLSAFDLFVLMVRTKNIPNNNVLFDIDFSKFEIVKYPLLKGVVLYDSENEIAISEFTHLLIVEYLKKIHGIEKKDESKEHNEIAEQLKHKTQYTLSQLVSEYPSYVALPISTFVMMLKNELINLRD